MKRILSKIMLTTVAGTLAFGNIAMADPGHGRGHGHGDWDNRGHYDRDYRDHDRGWRGDDRRWRDDDRGWHDNGLHRGWYKHSSWRRGGYVSYSDWERGRRIDYYRYHLRRPAYGYEWREVDGRFVMAAVASGLIASIILND
jgi:Ni/Co efflux regulator RcnB